MSEPTPMRSSGLEIETEYRQCDEHGEYEARRLLGRVWSRCPACQQAQDARKLAEAEEYARQQRADTIARIIGRSGIPKRFEGRTFEAFKAADEKQIRILKVCKAYAEKFDDRMASGGGLVMCGMPGTGKTHLACAIAHRIAEFGRTSLFVSALAAIRRVKQTYAKGSEETEQEAIERFYRPDLLILDEMGVQFGSDTEKMILFEIINGRYERMLPTILISNLTEAELAQFVGERAMDRMKEGGGVVLAFDWQSYRTTAKATREVAPTDWERLARRMSSQRGAPWDGAI